MSTAKLNHLLNNTVLSEPLDTLFENVFVACAFCAKLTIIKQELLSYLHMYTAQ